MNKPMALNVRVTGHLATFVAANIGEDGLYDNASEYVRDLIRKDLARVERERFAALKAELQQAFAEPEENAVVMDLDAFMARMKRRHA